MVPSVAATAPIFITRAITPPGFPRRFDARFFSADINTVAHRIENVVHRDAELVELTWVTIADARQLDLPMITHIVLEELEARVAAGLTHDLPVPFYQMQGSSFERGILHFDSERNPIDSEPLT